MLELACMSLFPGAMAFAGSMDLFTMTIPNRISLALIIGFFILAPFTGMDLQQFAYHLLAGLSMLAVGILFFWRGWIGGGDAKIFASASLWLGFAHLGEFIVFSAVIGGALTLALLVFRVMPLPRLLVEQPWIARLHDQRTGVPYGIAIAIAAMIIYPSTFWVSGLAS